MAASAVAGTTYYVDSADPQAADTPSNGTILAPFATIAYGIGQMSAGDDLWILEGTYNEGPLFLGRDLSASPSDYTVVRNYPGHKVHIRGDGYLGNGTDGGAFAISNCDYFKLIGIELSREQRTLEITDGSSYIEVTDCVVHDSGIQAFHIKENSHHVTITRCTVYDSGQETGAGSNAEGFYIGTGSSGPLDNTHQVTIADCLVYNTAAEAIDVKAGTHHITIEGCDIRNVLSYYSGTYTVGAIELTEAVLAGTHYYDNPAHVVRNNRIHDLNSGCAIMVDTGALVYGNTVWDVPSNGIYIRNNDGDSYPRKIYHNTVAVPSNGIVIGGGSPATDIQNNIGYEADTDCGGSDCNRANNDSWYVSTTEGGEIYKLVDGAGPINAGNDLSVTVATDDDGDPRGTDIGADEYAPSNIYMTSCTSSAMNSAFIAAKEGDTIFLPECSSGVTWSSTVSVANAGLKIRGRGVGRTVLISGTDRLLNISLQAGDSTFDISGITFNANGRDSGSSSIIQMTGGAANAFRIHDCEFINLYGTAIQVFSDGLATEGLIDNNVIAMNSGSGDKAIRVFGDGPESRTPMARGLALGTADAIYVEDNAIKFAGREDGALDAFGGARYVFRHNIVTGTNVEHHGADSGTYAETFSYEVYENTFLCKGSCESMVALHFRSGTGVVYNNEYAGNYTAPKIANYRSCNSYTFWDACDGTSSWDGNSGYQGYPCLGQIGYVFDENGGAGYTQAPLYEWNNNINGVDVDFSVNTTAPHNCSRHTAHIVENRDFFNDTQRPDYAAYTYPHPLTGEQAENPPAGSAGMATVQQAVGGAAVKQATGGMAVEQ